MDILDVKELFATKWLSLRQATYLDKNGSEQKWDYVSRTGDREVVTIICKDIHTDEYLFIIQPRPTIGIRVISFPAGLIDNGESPEEAALRELKEETGYDGTIIDTTASYPTSVGLSTESSYVVICEVDSTKQGKQKLEDAEDIATMWSNASEYNAIRKFAETKEGKAILKLTHCEFTLSEGSMLYMLGLFQSTQN